MRNNKLQTFFFDLLLFTVVIAFFYISSSLSKISFHDINYTDNNGKVVNFGNDFSKLRTIAPGKYLIKAKYQYNKFSADTINIVPDDCLEKIEINNISIQLKDNDKNNLCRNDFGINIDLSKNSYLGQNDISFLLTDNGGGGALHVKRAMTDFSTLVYILSIVLILGYLFFLAFRYLRLPKAILIIFFLGIIIRLIYLSYTNYDARVHDLGGHFDYMLYIVDHHVLPPANACWECHQKPLYYLISSFMFVIAKAIGFNEYQLFQILQIFSAVLFFVSAGFVYLIFKKLFTKNSLINLALSIYILWPAGIIHSLRIGNDALLYCLYTISLYFIISALQKSVKTSTLLIGLVFAGLSFFTKVTAFPLFVIILVIIVRNLRLNKNSLIKLFLIISLMGLIVYVGFSKYFQSSQKKDFFSHVVNSASLGKELAVENKPINYIFFDSKSFLNNSYNSPWDDQKGRQYFWNFFLKSTLFGEFEFNSKPNVVIVSVLNFLLLLIVLYASLSVFLIKSKDLRFFAILFFNLILLIAMLMLFRVVYPFACNQDFRYIFPVLISFSYLYTYVIDRAMQLKLNFVKYWGIGLMMVFLFLSSIFFIVYPFNI